jgi:RNA polymerase-binding transcription factor DksA
MALTPTEKKKLKQLLQDELGRLQKELADIQERSSRAMDVEIVSEVSGYDDHPADLASETFEREKDQAMVDALEATIGRVELAMEKLKLGTYGVCDGCGNKITKKRLDAVPYATLCVECQSRTELR